MYDRTLPSLLLQTGFSLDRIHSNYSCRLITRGFHNYAGGAETWARLPREGAWDNWVGLRRSLSGLYCASLDGMDDSRYEAFKCRPSLGWNIEAVKCRPRHLYVPIAKPTRILYRYLFKIGDILLQHLEILSKSGKLCLPLGRKIDPFPSFVT